MNRTDRLVGILLELQARGELRAEDLARTFEVSVRSVYRDMQALSETGVPVVATPGKGYRLMEGYFLPPLSFTPAEAALLLLGGEFVRGRVDPELRRAADDALRKLAGVLPVERRAEVARRRDEMLFTAPSREPSHLTRARAAIEERHVLHLLYHAYRRSEPEPRDVEPVKLVYLADAWHIAGYCRLRQASRLFRLDRIDRLEVLEERFTLGERHAVGPDPVEVWDRFPEARVRFSPEAHRWVRERPPYFFRREETDPAGPIFIFSLREEPALVSWLLSWGGAVEALHPLHLRDRLTSEAAAILARHASPSDLPDPSDARAAPATTVSGALP
ncbi:MAG: helix-turn-helix transcriptional regulator [Dehalococcoidia bacterium]